MWSTIEETPLYLEKLRLLVEPEKVLRSVGYVVQPLEPGVIESKKRCVHCSGKTNLSSPDLAFVTDISQGAL